jgi:hypothetical protein
MGIGRKEAPKLRLGKNQPFPSATWEREKRETLRCAQNDKIMVAAGFSLRRKRREQQRRPKPAAAIFLTIFSS